MAKVSSSYWYHLQFKLRLYESDGNAFQRLVSDILHARFQGFLAVRPYGRLGDGGNDGYVPSDGRYFQVHGPQAAAKPRPAETVRKAKEDFAKLRTNYPDVRHYSFVFNDRFEGVPRNVIDALSELEHETGIACDVVTSRNLEDWLMELSEEKRQSILQGVPVDLPQWIDPRAVGEVLSYLADTQGRLDRARERAPDFDEKIRFNALPALVADRLRAMSYQCGMVEDFLAPRGQHLAQAIAQELRELYSESQKVLPDDVSDASALRYLWLVERLVPQTANAHPHALKAYREAAEVVLAKYFESCDIYEQPGAASLAP